jgi:thiamine-monophosphate kinase
MTSEHLPLGPGGEFDLIRDLVRRWGSAAQGIGDDAAVLDVPAGERLVVSTDASVEDVHFRRDWLTPWEIGYRATAAALSDLAAMAATPLGVVVTLGIPPAWRGDIGSLGDGVAACAARAGAPIVGGDTTASGVLSVALTVLGSAARPLARSGACPGDRVYVTGRLGGPRLALEALLRGDAPALADRERFATPSPRIAEARWLATRAAHAAHAAIDLSDGLVADLRHMAAASGVRIDIDLERLPCVVGASGRFAAESGEEYELAIAADQAIETGAFERAFGLPLTEIGRDARLDAGEQPRVDVREGGEFVDLLRGYDHFSS